MAVLIAAVSCRTKPTGKSDLNYMQNIEQIAVDTALKNASQSTLQVGDQLVILVTAKDMSVVKPFNQNYSSSEMVQPNLPGGNQPNAGMTTVSGPTYIIDSSGDIDFPVLGRISTTGKTAVELKDEIRAKLTKYVINPTVSLRLTNFKVTVLGEVNRQGNYVIPNAQGTLLDALGLAGDTTMYGKRNDVLVVRNVDGQITKGRVDLTDADFFNSPFFNLKQGDVIYVSANQTREKTARLDPNTSLYLSLAGVAVAVLGILVTVFKK